MIEKFWNVVEVCQEKKANVKNKLKLMNQHSLTAAFQTEIAE